MMQQSQEQYEEEPRLKSYLDALEKPLEPLGEAAQSDWRQEAEAHIRSLVAAHEELGLSQEQALAVALKQFGDTQRIGKNVAHEMRKRRLPSREMEQILRTTVVQAFGVVGIVELGNIYQSETTAGVHLLVRLTASSLFVIVPLISGWSWQQLLLPEKRKWVRIAAFGIFPQYGFYAGYVYATMFDLRFGSDAVFSVSTLMGILCFALFPLLSAYAQRRLQPIPPKEALTG